MPTAIGVSHQGRAERDGLVGLPDEQGRCVAIVVIGPPKSSPRSPTAARHRMAGSPRLTMASRRTPDISPPSLAACRSGAHRIADRPLEIGWQRAVKADGAVAVDAEDDGSFVVQHLAVEAAVVSAMGDGEQLCLRRG